MGKKKTSIGRVTCTHTEEVQEKWRKGKLKNAEKTNLRVIRKRGGKLAENVAFGGMLNIPHHAFGQSVGYPAGKKLSFLGWGVGAGPNGSVSRKSIDSEPLVIG